METRRIKVNSAPIPPPDMNKAVQVTVEGATHEFRIVSAVRNRDGTWDLELEPPEWSPLPLEF